MPAPNLLKPTTRVVNAMVQYTHPEQDSNFDILALINSWASYETSELIDDLPHLGAVIEFWELVTVTYDVSLADEVHEAIMEGVSSPTPWNEFVIKYGLSKKKWVLYKREGKKISIM